MITVHATDFYPKFMGFFPTEPQASAFESFWKGPPSLTTVVLPTGEGKTELAVAPFLAQFAANTFPIAARLIYVLPSRTLSNQICKRIEQYARRVAAGAGQRGSGTSPRRIVVAPQHGAAPSDPFFFADVVVTTLDQFVYGYARAQRQEHNHPDLAAGAIATSLVVFDEAHGYSPYTLALLKAMLEILHKARIPVVLMSATMPDTLRHDLTRHVPVKEQLHLTIETSPTRGGNLTPIRVKRSVSLVRQSGLLFDSQTNKLHPALASRLREATRALVVCNTVAQAQRVFQGIQREIPHQTLMLIHARYTARDRALLEKRVTELLGREGSGGIVITTQVCEAGLNISADFLATEMAPADALVQRGGRCGRFMIDDNSATGEVWVFDPGESTYQVYGREVEGHQALEMTEAFLQQHGKVDLGDWGQVVAFCQGLPYQTDELAAAESLRELQEATLYADYAPHRIRVREDLNAYLWVGTAEDLKTVKSGRAYRERLVSIRLTHLYRYAQMMSQQKKTLEELVWDLDPGRFVTEKRTRPAPFRTYRLDTSYYDPLLGVIW